MKCNLCNKEKSEKIIFCGICYGCINDFKLREQLEQEIREALPTKDLQKKFIHLLLLTKFHEMLN
ncbi:hypothetical protein HOD96_00570 [Candidatus Falkowbacteria bacterium]|jgi:hypothetical protein|nr:hypothetical protein [Candidatus Falkowbacteria bacterium]